MGIPVRSQPAPGLLAIATDKGGNMSKGPNRHKPSPKRKFWHEAFRVARLRKEAGATGREVFTEPWIKLASCWPTCACGTGDPRIPRWPGGLPRDLRLSGLGVDFVAYVRAGDVDAAERVMAAIDQRETEVLIALGYIKPAR